MLLCTAGLILIGWIVGSRIPAFKPVQNKPQEIQTKKKEIPEMARAIEEYIATRIETLEPIETKYNKIFALDIKNVEGTGDKRKITCRAFVGSDIAELYITLERQGDTWEVRGIEIAPWLEFDAGGMTIKHRNTWQTYGVETSTRGITQGTFENVRDGRQLRFIVTSKSAEISKFTDCTINECKKIDMGKNIWTIKRMEGDWSVAFEESHGLVFMIVGDTKSLETDLRNLLELE